MVSTITENENLPTGEFTPFNDTDNPQVVESVQLFTSATQGYDTSTIDRFRQGVEMRIPKHVYSSTQPKLWTGNLKHKINLTTYGQARSFVEFDNSKIFDEKPEFNSVWYINDPNYPLPIVFNDGPQEEEEAIIEPFTIPMRKNTNEGPFYPRSPKASLEDGNNFDNLNGGTTRVEQFIEYSLPLEPRFFLDEGQSYFGGITSGSIIIEGFTPFINRNIDPFNDTKFETIVDGIQTTDTTFIAELMKLDFDLSEDIRGTFARKSATAGNVVYGPDSAKYGTDSITYCGLTRGA